MDTATDEMNLKINITEDGPAARTLAITIPAEVVDERIEASYGNLQNQAQMRGFRKGKAPRHLLRKRFGQDVINETRGQLIMGAYQQAIQQNELRVVGDPDFPDELMEKPLEEGKEFSFEVSIEVAPEFDLPALENVAIKKPIFEIDESHVDNEMKQLAFRFGTPENIKKDFQPLDRLIGRASVDVEDHDGVFFETDKTLVVVPDVEDEGKGPVLGLLLEDLGERLEGAAIGSDIVFETVGPPAHERSELRDKKITINFHVTDCERITPLETETLVTTFGLEDEAMLRERLKLEIENRRDQEQRAAEREQVFEYLLDNTTLALPQKISEAQVARTIERQRMDLLYRGDNPEQVEKQLAEMRDQTQEQAINRLKLLFIMDKVARHFDIEVSDQEVNGRIAMMAQQRGERPDAVRTELQKTGGLQEVARQIMEHKAADRIVDQADVTEVPAADWNKEATEKAEKRKSGAGKKAASKKAAKKKTAKKAAKKTAGKAESKKKTTKKTK
ncbi:MAG TPA: trigger factor [Phycisphaerales bacterium]|nr:trigger factor [Phycisphaerales bacterium]